MVTVDVESLESVERVVVFQKGMVDVDEIERLEVEEKVLEKVVEVEKLLVDVA